MLGSKEGKRKSVKGKHRKLWLSITAVALALLLVGGVFVSGGLGFLTQSGAAEGGDYQVVSLTTGTLTDSVTGTGSLEMDGTALIEVPSGVTIDRLNVEAGDSVKAGDALVTLDSKSVKNQLDALNTQLTTLNTELAALSGDTADASITATVKGRVKVIYGQSGQSVVSVMNQYGALMLLSVDGTMKVELDVSGLDVSINQDVVVVMPSGTKLSGYIYSIANSGLATVLVSDKTLAVGENVTVQDEDSKVLGSGVAQINNPLRITGTSGTIKSLSVSANSSVSKGSTLLYLKNLPISADYATKLAEQDQCLTDIEAMQAYRSDPVVRSDADGIINTINLSAGQVLQETEQIVLTTKDSVMLKVSIDELDILKISAGMKASVTLDAISGESFEGSVTQISSLGTTTSNVTTYPVKITLTDDTRFLPGMSASASVTVKESQNALLIPVSALNTTRGETFVYVNSESGVQTLSTSTETEPGIRTVITTGLSNDQYAEVLSGLNPSDQVLVMKSAGTTSGSSSNERQSSMMDMGMMGGGEPPSGMSGGQRPDRQS